MTAYASLAQLRAYLPQVSDWGQQLITITGGPSGGTFTLAYDGAATSAVAPTATATTVQTALRAVSAIGASGVTVTGAPGGPWLAAFQGALSSDAAPLTLGTNSLTGGTSPSVTIGKAMDTLLTDVLDRATDLVRQAMRSALDDPTFDYAAWGVASTRIMTGYGGSFLHVPPCQAASITVVETQSASAPVAWTAIDAAEWDQEGDRLYRSGGFSAGQRYRVTAVWGYGPTIPDVIEEVTLEAAVNLWRGRDKGGFTELINAEGASSVRVIAGLSGPQRDAIGSVVAQLLGVSV